MPHWFGGHDPGKKEDAGKDQTRTGDRSVVFADPEEIEALARRLDDHAEEVRTGCRSFEKEVGGVRWESTGAEHYRSQCAALVADLGGNAQEMNDCADLLRVHAQKVRERIAWMHDMVDQLRNQAQEAWDDATHAAGDAFEWGEDKAEGALNKVKSWL